MEALIVKLLRGECADWPYDEATGPQVAFLEAAARHAVAPLLAHRLCAGGAVDAWPPEIGGSLRDALRQAAILETVRQRELRSVLTAFADAGVRPLLMKGSALAYLHYAEPYLRPRWDTDVLVPKSAAPAAAAVLRALGYCASVQTSGALVSYQREYTRTGAPGFDHALDLHWKITNPQAVADVLSYDEVMARSVPVPALGAGAHALGSVDALLLACVHRVAHHYQSRNTLIWLYDIHLLVASLDEAALGAFAARAAARRVAAVCADGLAAATAVFGPPVPGDVLERLDVAGRPEPSVALLDPSARRVDLLISDLRALTSWRARWRLLREHVCPPPEYMLARASGARRWRLPALYAGRVARGAGRWLRSRKAADDRRAAHRQPSLRRPLDRRFPRGQR